MDQIQKPNDIFVASVMNPNGSLLNLVESGITPDNTGFLSIDDYKNTPFVKKTFTNDKGIFNEDAFKNAYILAANNYKDLTDKDFYKNLSSNIEYSPTSRAINTSSKIRDISPNIIKINNPFEAKRGITSMFGINESDKSIREIAQTQKIWNTDNQKWEDKSPNDLGLLGTLFNKDTLVYAQWEEDGTHFDEELGRNISHKKGEYKINENGKFYTETLGNREIYGKEAVSPTDVLTKDEGFLNNIDFFDSDGKEKSITGITFKTLASIAPYIIPQTRALWGGITAATQLVTVLPTFYKSLENIFTGEDNFDNQSSLWKGMNSVEGFMTRFNSSKSDNAKQSAFAYENISEMVGDIFGQIHQQKAVASLTKLLPNTATSVGDMLSMEKKFIDRSNLAKQLTLGYMSLVTTGDIYSEAIAGGYDRRTAGIAALVSAAGQMAVMQHPMMTWFLGEEDGFIEKASRKTIRNAIAEPIKEISEAISKYGINSTEAKQGLGKALRKTKDSIFRGFLDVTNDDIFKNSLREGIEEVTEQMVQDGTKGVIDALSSLGITKSWGGKQGSFGGTDVVFSQEGLTNYLMNFAGGLLGGAMFDFQTKHLDNLLTGKMPKQDEYSLYRLIANGQTENIIEELNRNRKYVGNRYLSPQTVDINGVKVSLSSNEGASQSDIITDATINYIKQLDGIINQEGLAYSDNELINKVMSNQIADELEKDTSGIGKLIISDFNKLTGDIIEKRTKLKDLESNDEAKNSKEYNKLKSELEEDRLKVKDYLDGKKDSEYVAKSLMYFNPEIHSAFLALDKIQYTKTIYNQEYNDLPDSGGDLNKERIDKEFKEYQDQPNLIDKLNTIFDVYKEFQKIFSNPIKEYTDSYIDTRVKTLNETSGAKNQDENGEIISFIRSALKQDPDALKSLSTVVDKSSLKNFNLEDLIKNNLYDYLVNNKIIDVSELDENELNLIKNYFNTLSLLPISEINYNYIINHVNILNNNPDIKNKILLTDKKLDTANLQQETLLNFIEKQDKVDNEIFLRLKKDLDSKKINQINKLHEMAGDLTSKIRMLFDDISYSEIDENIKENILNNLELFSDEDLELEKIASELKSKNDLGEDYREFAKNYVNLANEKIKELYNLINQSGDENLINNISKILNEIQDFVNTVDIFTNDRLFDSVSKLSKIKSLEHNPIYDILRKLDLTIEGGVRKSIFDLLEEESNVLSQSSIENYLREGYTYDLIAKGINTLKMAKSIVTGMMTKQNLENPWGFNQSIINYINKNKTDESIDDYQLISDDQGAVIYSEFNNLTDKLEFLRELSNSNNEAKEKEHIQTREKFNNIILKYYSDNRFEYKGSNLIPNKNDILNRNDISDEHKIILIESEIYNEFKNLNLTTDDEIREFFNEFLKNELNEDFALKLLNDKNDGLVPNMTSLSPKTIFDHLISILAVDSKEIAYKLNKVLSNPEFKFAPFFSQEYDARIAYSNHKNHKLFELAYDLVLSNLDINTPRATRINSILGISGAGKTAVTGKYILNFMLQDDSKQSILVSGPNDNRTDALYTSLTENLDEEYKNGNISKANKKSLFDKFVYYDDNGEKASFLDRLQEETKELEKQSFIEIEENGQKTLDRTRLTTDENGIITFDREIEDGKIYNISNIRLVKGDEKIYKFKDNSTVGKIPSAIFIDEITHFSSLELELLADIADNYNISLYTFGDSSQNGFRILNYKYSVSQLITISTPYLKSTIRSSNTQQKDNSLTLNIISDKLENLALLYSGQDLGIEQIKFLNESNRVLKYYENPKELNGTKLVGSLTKDDALRLFEAISNVRKIEGKENQILGIITEDGTNADEEIDLLKSVGFTDDMIQVYGFDNNGLNPVQGREGDYFIVKMPNIIEQEGVFNNNISVYMSNLYTGTGRALVGSIIIDENSQYLKYNISNKKDEIPFIRSLDVNRMISLKEQRIKDLNPIIKDFSYSTEEEKTKENITSNEEEKPDIEVEEYKEPEFDPEPEDNFDDFEKQKPEEKEEKNNKLIFHTFYNRFGVNSEENDQDSYLVTKPESQEILEDLQIYKGNIGEKINKSDIDSFIKLKNIVSLHYNDLKNLKYSIESNKELQNFLENKIGITSEKLIEQIKLENFFINSSIYDNSIDRSAFKYKYNSDKTNNDGITNGSELKNGDVFSRFSIKFTLNDGKEWILSLAALPNIETINQSFVTEILDENTIRNYNDFHNKLKSELVSKNNILVPLKSLDKTYISATKGVQLIRENSTNNIHQLIDADKIETAIPGVFLNKLDNGNINIFTGDIKSIRDEFQQGVETKKNLENSYLQKLTGRPYVVLSFDNNSQLDPSHINQHRKVYPLNPKSRNLETMIKEFTEFHKQFSNIKNKTNEEKIKQGRGQNIFISSAEGLKLFYLIKQNLSKDNFDKYCESLISTINYSLNRLNEKSKDSENYKEYDKSTALKVIEELNNYNSYDEYKKSIIDIKSGRKKGNLSLDALSKNNKILGIGVNILTNYNWLEKVSKNPIWNDKLSKEINEANIKNNKETWELISSVFENLKNEIFHYNPFATKVYESANKLQFDPEYLKYFTLNIVPEPARYVININDTIEDYLTNKSTENEEIKSTESTESIKPIKKIEEIEETDEEILQKCEQQAKDYLINFIKNLDIPIKNKLIEIINNINDQNEFIQESFNNFIDLFKYVEYDVYDRIKRKFNDPYLNNEKYNNQFNSTFSINENSAETSDTLKELLGDFLDSIDSTDFNINTNIIKNFDKLFC